MGDKLTCCCPCLTADCASAALQQSIREAPASAAAASTAAAPAGAFPPDLSGLAPSQDIHCLVHSFQKRMSWLPSPAMSAGAHLVEETALGCSGASRAWRGLRQCLPVPGCGCVVGLCGFFTLQAWATSSHAFVWRNNTSET